MVERMDIVYQSSDTFSMMAGTSMLSLFCNHKHIPEIEVYILDAGITEINKSKLRTIAKAYNRIITFIDIDKYLKWIQKMKLSKYNGSYVIYMKAFLAEFFDVNKNLLYLDCDTVIDGKLDYLWQMNMNQKSIAMAIDCMNTKLKTGYGMKKNQLYYNTGVILFNLENWKEHECQKKFVDYVRKSKKRYPFADQDLINLCLNDEVYTLPLEFNCISLYEKYNLKEIEFIYGLNEEDYYTLSQYEKGRKKPIVYHFPTVMLSRPWFNDCLSGWEEIYNKYLYHENNPWNNYKKVHSNMGKFTKVQRLIFKYFPRKIFDIIQKLASYYYNVSLLKHI